MAPLRGRSAFCSVDFWQGLDSLPSAFVQVVGVGVTWPRVEEAEDGGSGGLTPGRRGLTAAVSLFAGGLYKIYADNNSLPVPSEIHPFIGSMLEMCVPCGAALTYCYLRHRKSLSHAFSNKRSVKHHRTASESF